MRVMAELVSPIQARQGKFLGSFQEIEDMTEFVVEIENAMKHMPIHGRIVYSYMTAVHEWQVFIIPS